MRNISNMVPAILTNNSTKDKQQKEEKHQRPQTIPVG